MRNKLFKKRSVIDLIHGKIEADLKRKTELQVEKNGTTQI